MTDLQLEAMERKRQHWMGREVIVMGEHVFRGAMQPTSDEGTVIKVDLRLSKLVLTIKLDDGRVVDELAQDVMIKSTRRFNR